MKVTIIDGQSGRLGQLVVKAIVEAKLDCYLYAIGTNSIATSVMIKAGANFGATGENPVCLACKDSDVIIGPIGIVCADAMLGEISPKMAKAIGQSTAIKLLLPYNHCNNQVVGAARLTMNELVNECVKELTKIIK